MKRNLLNLKIVITVALWGASVISLYSSDVKSVQDSVEQKAPIVEHPENKKPKFKFYGFVRNYFIYDSRQNYQSNEGLYNQIPKDENLNEIGEDLNEIPSSKFLAMTSRLGVDVSGIKAFNADLSAKIETDFCGFSSSTTMLRIRQAYVKMKWEKNALLFGQTWHPMSSDLPDVLGLASGSPFHPFSRTPQIRYDFSLEKIRFTLASLWQFQYKSVGPDGADTKYLNQSILPEFYVGFDFANKKGFQIGTGLDMVRLKPRTTCLEYYVSGEDEETGKEIYSNFTKKIDENFFSTSPVLFLNYKKNKFLMRFRTTYARSTTHLNMMSGYGVTGINEDGSREYSPLRSLSSWIYFSYGKDLKFNLFGGYIKNFGMEKALVPIVSPDGKTESNLYTRSNVSNIDCIYRISPAISYTMKRMTFGVEYEWTAVSYGDGYNDFAEVEGIRTIANNRICGLVRYSW